MVGAGVLCFTTLGYCALIICSALGGTWVFTLGGADLLSVCSTLGGAPGLFRRSWNMVSICLRDSSYVSPIFANCASGFGCSSVSVKYFAGSMARSAEDMNGILVWWGIILLYPQTFKLLLCSYISGDTCSAPYLFQFITPLTHVVPILFLYMDFHEWPLCILEGKVVFNLNKCSLQFCVCCYSWVASVFP